MRSWGHKPHFPSEQAVHPAAGEGWVSGALTQGTVPTAHGGRPARAAAAPKPRQADVGAQSASAREEGLVNRQTSQLVCKSSESSSVSGRLNEDQSVREQIQASYR